MNFTGYLKTIYIIVYNAYDTVESSIQTKRPILNGTGNCTIKD